MIPVGCQAHLVETMQKSATPGLCGCVQMSNATHCIQHTRGVLPVHHVQATWVVAEEAVPGIVPANHCMMLAQLCALVAALLLAMVSLWQTLP